MEMADLNEVEVEVIRGLADNNMNITQTATALYMHRNTVSYRIERIRKKTGIDPMNFYGLCKLLMLVGQMERMADNAETRERQ
jgi:carbohydrate diacid regulator